MKNQESVLKHKPQAIIFRSFFLVILIGAILFKLPIASAKAPLSGIDALFMSTSAVCVTGLSIVDIGTDLTLFGQLVLLTLMQLGGLGIMTFSLLFLIFIGKKISLHFQMCIPDLFQDINLKNIRYCIFSIFIMTLLIESAGAFFLFLDLRNYHPVPFAVYSSIFHSISAFCNAGFSLYSDSFVRFNNNPYILIVMMSLIVLGGLGFIVIYEIFRIITKRQKPSVKTDISLHTKIALTGSFLFIIIGAVIVWILENQALLRNMPLSTQMLNSFFLSVTSRTAGFNTIHTSLLSNPTLLMVMFMMFVGACPGSTGGGIKMHVFFTLIALLRNKLKGLEMASLFKRKIPPAAVDRAVTILISSFLVVFIAVFLLQLTENILIAHAEIPQAEEFLDTIFESISAFGTVGLSTGTTAHLSFGGKAIIIFLMFVGRIGALTLGIALEMRQKDKITYEYPTEEIIVS